MSHHLHSFIISGSVCCNIYCAFSPASSTRTRYPTHADLDRQEDINQSIRNAESRASKLYKSCLSDFQIISLINSFIVVQRPETKHRSGSAQTSFCNRLPNMPTLFLFLLLLLPLALQPAVGFGLSNNIPPFLSICRQLSPSPHS